VSAIRSPLTDVGDRSPTFSGRPKRLRPTELALQDWAASLQDDVLDEAYPWIQGLQVNEGVRDAVFAEFCAATGELLNRIVEKAQSARLFDVTGLDASDCLVAVQDDVLDEAHARIQELPLDVVLLSDISDRLCIVTGQILNRMLETAPI